MGDSTNISLSCSHVGSMPPHSKHLWEEGMCVKSFMLVKNSIFQEEGELVTVSFLQQLHLLCTVEKQTSRACVAHKILSTPNGVLLPLLCSSHTT